MTLPSSGQISIGDIVTEKSEAQGNDSLQSLSTTNINSNSAPNVPDQATPHAISEFYGYNHNASAALTAYGSSKGNANSAQACADILYGTFYHDGAGADPIVGDLVYSDVKGTAPLGLATYHYQAINSWYSVDSKGTVNGSGGCRSERRLKKNIEYIGTSAMGIPMYYFEYKNPQNAPNGDGKYLGTMVDDLQRLGMYDVLFVDGSDICVDYNKLDIDCKLV